MGDKGQAVTLWRCPSCAKQGTRTEYSTEGMPPVQAVQHRCVHRQFKLVTFKPAAKVAVS